MVGVFRLAPQRYLVVAREGKGKICAKKSVTLLVESLRFLVVLRMYFLVVNTAA